MAILVGSKTYDRFVWDPEEGEQVYLIDGKEVTADGLEEALGAEGAQLTGAFNKPKAEAKRITVTYRPLRAADKHAIQDLIRLDGDDSRGIAGSGRRMQLKRAVVKWDYEVAWTESVLDSLDPALEEMIYSWVSWGIEALEQDPETGRPIPLEDSKPTASEEETEKPAKGRSTSKTKTDSENTTNSEDAPALVAAETSS